MDWGKIITNPNINAFDIVDDKSGKGYEVKTLRKPGESLSDYIARHEKNKTKANQLKNKTPGN